MPTGCGAFPSQYDNRGLPINRDPALARKAAETRYNVVHATIAAKGGHFPALEQPQAWMDDLRTFVSAMASRYRTPVVLCDRAASSGGGF